MLVPICLLICQAPTTIDLELKAARLPVVIDALAAKTQEKLFCSPQLGRHVVVVKLDSVTPAEARRKIAEAVDAEWQDRNGTLTLLRTAAKERELNAKWRDGQRKTIADGLASLFDQLEKTPKFTPAVAQKLLSDLNAQDVKQKEDAPQVFGDYFKLSIEHARGPGGRAITRVLKLLGPDGISDLPVGRTVMAIAPTRLQRPLPIAAKDVLRQWVDEQRTWTVALEGQPNQERGMMMGTDPRLSKFGEGEISRLLLIIMKYGPRANVNFDLRGFNTSGELVCRASISTHPTGFTPERLKKAYEIQAKKGTFTLSPESMEKYSFSRMDYVDTKKPSPEWIKALSDPVTRDPLSYEHSEVLLALAKERKRNMVADLSEDMRIPSLDQPVPPPINLEAYLRYNETMLSIEVAEDDRWLIIKPWSQLGPPNLPEDRFAVRKLIQSGLRDGYFSIEAMAEHAVAANEDWNGTSFYLARILLPRSERILQDAPQRALRFYGFLSPMQQKTMREGGSVDFIQLSPASRQALLNLVTNPSDSHRDGGLFINGQNRSVMLENDLDSEPTEFLAQGLGSGSIAAKIESQEQLMVGTIGGQYVAWTRFIKPENLAAALKSPQGAHTKDDDYWMGSSLNLKVAVKLSATTELRFTLTEHRYDFRQDGVKMEKLPEAIRKKIDGG